jgi:hypothetical protein
MAALPWGARHIALDSWLKPCAEEPCHKYSMVGVMGNRLACSEASARPCMAMDQSWHRPDCDRLPVTGSMLQHL